MELTTSQEFIAANFLRLNRIVEAIEGVSYACPSYEVEGSSPDEMKIVSGICMPEYFIEALAERGVLIDENAARDQADIANLSTLTESKLMLYNTLACGQIEIAIRQAQRNPDEEPRELPFAFEAAKVTGSVVSGYDVNKITVTGLTGYDRTHDVEMFEAKRYQLGMVEALTIVKLDGSIVSCAFNVTLEDDPDVSEWVRNVSEQLGGVMQIAMGRYETEEELDNTLSEIYMAYQGRAEEDMIGAILEKLRVRATAAKEIAAMNAQFADGLPRIEVLDEFLNALQA
jgi:hypothetical protein